MCQRWQTTRAKRTTTGKKAKYNFIHTVPILGPKTSGGSVARLRNLRVLGFARPRAQKLEIQVPVRVRLAFLVNLLFPSDIDVTI